MISLFLVLWYIFCSRGAVSDLLAFDPLVSCHWSSLILGSVDEFYMKTDTSGRRKVEPIFNIFPPSSFSEFDVHGRHLAKPETGLFFTASPWYKTFWKSNMYLSIKEMFVQCHSHPVNCIYIYTLSPKHAFTLLLTGRPPFNLQWSCGE